MKLKLQTFTILLLLFVTCFHAKAQAQTTEGRTFWLTYMENLGGTGGCSDNTTPILKVIITCDTAASGSITNPNTNVSYAFSIGNAGGIDTVFIPVSEAYMINAESATDKQKGLLVQSSHPVSVSAQNIKSLSSEATTILPIEALETEYRVVSFPGDLYGNNACYRSCFAIVATEDSTTIDIIPSCNTSGGKTGGVSFSIILNRGETYFIKAATNKLDLSGTSVKAKNCKRIAVFGGATRSAINFGTCSASYDHLYEQMIPVKLWSTKYHITPTIYLKNYTRKAELIKIVASLNSTTVRVNGRLKVLSIAGNSDTFYVTSDAVVISNKPIAVYQFSISNDCDKVSGGTDTDPMMIMVNPSQSFLKDISFGIDNDSSKYRAFLNVITPTKYKDSLTLDGKTIASTWTKFTKDSLYSYIQLDSIKRGKHHIKSKYGFTAFQYTYGDNSGMGINTGFNFKSKIEASISNYTASEDNVSKIIIDTCANSTITFNATATNQTYTSWKWLLQDGSSIIEKTSNPTSYKYKNGGLFDVTLIGIKSLYGVCNGQTNSYDSLKFNIHLFEKANLNFLKSKPKVCKDSVLTIYVSQFDKQKSSKFYWTFNGTDTVSNDTMITRTIKAQNTFVFNYTDSNNCFFRDTITVTGLNNPTFKLATPINKCVLDTIRVETTNHIYNPLYTYKWYINNVLDNSNDSFIEYNGSSDARIQLSVSNQGICHYSDTTYFKVFPTPSFSIIGLNNYTTKDTINLVTDKAFASYKWFNDTTSRNNKFPASNLGQPGKYWAWCIVKDYNGCEASDSLEITLEKSSLVNTIDHNKIKIYPNPMSTILTIETEQAMLYELFSIDGKMIMSSQLQEGKNTLDVSTLERGLYMVKLAQQQYILIKQ